MENYRRITDDDAFKTIKEIDNNDENALANALKTIVLLNIDIRQFLRKIYQNMDKKQVVYKQPTGNKEDVIVGKDK